MQNYPEPARKHVLQLTTQAAQDPEAAIAFQGAPGAYSHLATLEVDAQAHALPCYAFEDAFDAVEQERAGRAVIPIENSQAGRVADIHFLLPQSRLHIIGEHFLRVRHCLLGLPGRSLQGITQALSHSQALSQCRGRLRSLGLRPVAYADTAAAAAWLAEAQDPQVGAIASSLAGALYGLDILAQDIEDVSHNTTRFVILAKAPLSLETLKALGGPLMTSLSFEVRNVPAALFKALGGFATNGVNMTKLESYQREGSFTASEFYADIEGSPHEPAVARALDELAYHSKWVRLLGTYPQAKSRA
jgi:prephenate dehydratase